MQPTSIMLGQSLGAVDTEHATSELQQVISKVIAVLCYRRWLFLIPLLLGMLISLMISLCIPRKYTVNTVFERSDDPAAAQLITSRSQYSFTAQRRNMNLKLTGTKAIAAAIEDLGLTKDFPRDENGVYTPQGRAREMALVGKLVGRVKMKSVVSDPYYDQVQIWYHGSDPELGASVISQLRDNYIEDIQELLSENLHEAKEFFSEQQERLSKLSAQLQTKLTEMTTAYPGIDSAGSDPISQQLVAIDVRIEDLILRRANLEAKVATLTEHLQEIGQQPSASQTTEIVSESEYYGMWIPNPQRKQLEDQINKVKARIAELKAINGMTDAHPRVVVHRHQLEQFRAKLEQEPLNIAAPQNQSTSMLDPVKQMDPVERDRQRIALDIKTAKQEIANVDRELTQRKTEKKLLEEKRDKLSERRPEFLLLKEKTQNAQNEMKDWKKHNDSLNRLLTAEKNDRMAKFTTVEKAYKPIRPASPSLSGIFILSSGVGVALATTLVFLREVFDRSFRDPAKVQTALGIPVLETVGLIQAKSKSARFNRRMLMPAVVAIEAVGVTLMASLVYLSLSHPAIYDNFIGRVALGTALHG